VHPIFMTNETLAVLTGCYCTVNLGCILLLDRAVSKRTLLKPSAGEVVISYAVFILLGIPLVTAAMVWHAARRAPAGFEDEDVLAHPRETNPERPLEVPL
jgi:hypothetical protein